jgi:hypothetical protein
MKRLFITLTMLIAAFGAFAQNFDCFVLVPPAKPLPDIKKIAILNFANFNQEYYYDTYGGTAFTDYLTSSMLDETRGLYNSNGGLFSKKVNGKSYIKCNSINTISVIEREQLNKVLAEKNLGSNVAINDNDAAQVGKVLGIDALITGTIKYDYNTNRTVVKYQDGSSAYKTENTCQTEITVKIISVATAQILATKSFTYTSSDAKTGSEEKNVLGFEQLAPTNLKILAFGVACYMLPWYFHDQVTFNKIKVADYKDKAKKAIDYINNEDFKSAYAIYKAIYDADNYNADAAYNLAQLTFIVGDFKGCATWDSTAAQIDAGTYGKLYEAAKGWVANGKTLESLGVIIEKYDFGSATNASNALADKVTTTGKNSDRLEVYEKADKTSKVVAKIPGATEFSVVEKSGSFTCIQLLGGKKGYIDNDNLK